MTPLTDPRPFAEVLSEWMARHNLSAYAVAKRIGARQGVVVTRWLAGGPVTFEPAVRGYMTLVDEGMA